LSNKAGIFKLKNPPKHLTFFHAIQNTQGGYIDKPSKTNYS
jgi:hypothetical protein